MALELSSPSSFPKSIADTSSNPTNSAAGKGGGGGRITSLVVLSSIVAASGGILFGYDLGISGGVTATGSFLHEFFPGVAEKMKSDSHVSNYCKFNSPVLTAFTSSLYVAGLLASLVASRVTEKYGHRTSMLAGAALFLAGSAAGGAAVNVGMLIVGRILLGFGVGFSNQSIPVYLSEMAPPQYRGAISGGFDSYITFGIFVANLINYGTHKIKAGWGWRLSLSAAALPAAFLLIGATFLPETPSCIIHRGGDIQAARRILRKIRGTTEIDEEIDGILIAKAAATKAVSTANPFLLLLRRNYRPYLVMAIMLPMFVNITGVSAVNFYAPVMFRSIGLNENASLMSAVIIRGIGFACTFIATLVAVDRFGRRAMLLMGGLVLAVSITALGAVLMVGMKERGPVNSGSAYAVLALVCIFVAAFGWSWGPMVWLVSSEIYPMEIRSAGMGIQVLVSLLMNFVVAQSLLAMLCGLKAGLFFLFGGGTVAMTAFVYWLLPETKGVALEKMGSIWSEHWYWKRFATEVERDDGEGKIQGIGA